MMIKITEKCSMGCTHCMNDSKPVDRHMDMDTFKKSIDFFNKYGGITVIISGGEPTEHPDFLEFVKIFMASTPPHVLVCIATNGIWMQNHTYETMELLNRYSERLLIQVTSVDGYYPTKIDTSLPIFKHKLVKVCTEIESMYPQGKALTNNIPHPAPKGPKCANVRLIMHQIQLKSLRNMMAMMLARKGLVCTPHIGIDGSIKLGESDLCPACSSIYKSEKEIIQDILAFRCKGCKEALDNLIPQARAIIGE